MGGRSSRNKGKRGEYLVRDHLRTVGFIADRVPSSGAAQGFKGDVKSKYSGVDYLFEVKSRQNSFGSIYDLFNSFKGPILNLVYNDTYITISKDPLHVISLGIQAPLASTAEYKATPRTLARLFNLSKLLGTADILAIKDNNKPLLYIRYVRTYGPNN